MLTLLSLSKFYFVLERHIIRIILYLPFSDWFLLLRNMYLWSIHTFVHTDHFLGVCLAPQDCRQNIGPYSCQENISHKIGSGFETVQHDQNSTKFLKNKFLKVKTKQIYLWIYTQRIFNCTTRICPQLFS